eukprot:GHUV01045716.1.p3 GENE.GHUV01045716.1~~GHUV01045716.1.p3  ORF type:complete len:104 (+),score=44.19 GHUV01045716.1:189-500(+)
MLEQHDTDAAQGLAAVLSLPQLQYQELLQVEGHPSNTSRQAYVDQAVQQLLVHDVEWQYQALRQGFYTVMDRQVRVGVHSGVGLQCRVTDQAPWQQYWDALKQ